ncbi:hypothetical protein FACS189483_05430 [Spirochaetia bacterium]|nr:hypothetical protein FACS189483_05430 [Spirochaetia bacterium]
MKQIRFITRADDAGSSLSANEAIRRALKAGFIRNVSLMAVGNKIEDAAEKLPRYKANMNFGMHGVLNAEWDKVKWGPITKLDASSGLVDEQGYFLPDPEQFANTKPTMEIILREYDAQLDRLTRLGFPVAYVDSHMFPEKYIPGMFEAMNEWIKRKGLINHIYFYNLPPGFEKVVENPKNLVPMLKAIPEGQYFYVAHPAVYSEEMLLTGNSSVSGKDVARARNGEAQLLAKKTTPLFMRLIGITPIRYDQAVPGPALDPANPLL